MKFILKKSLITLSSLVVLTSVPITTDAQQRRYSEPEIHAFAMAQLNSVQEASFRNDREYCGLIGLDKNGVLTATSARQGDINGCRLKRKPWRFKIIASYHTHGAFNRRADTEVPSISDLKHDFKQRINGYIATPGGRVWFNDSYHRISTLLCQQGCLLTDPNYFDCPTTTPQQSYTIDDLKWRARNVNDPC